MESTGSHRAEVERRVLAPVRSELDGLDEASPEGYSIGDLAPTPLVLTTRATNSQQGGTLVWLGRGDLHSVGEPDSPALGGSRRSRGSRRRGNGLLGRRSDGEPENDSDGGEATDPRGVVREAGHIRLQDRLFKTRSRRGRSPTSGTSPSTTWYTLFTPASGFALPTSLANGAVDPMGGSAHGAGGAGSSTESAIDASGSRTVKPLVLRTLRVTPDRAALNAPESPRGRVCSKPG